FIFQTQKDDPRNALMFALELAQQGIPHEVHTFTEGRHGGALYDGTNDAPDIPHTARWAPLAWEWLEANGF
ncbi:MAG: alpha/beta hydrolase, partial [Clostridia bacterium]|nr:alpha/beta hydrolase [Clostridia bacterium]